MIPILYESTETKFRSNGLGRLSDCTRCVVTEERNGIYECEFDYPITGVHYEDLIDGRIVAVTHDDKQDIQPFDIYRHTAPINGIVTFYAHHISYRLNGIVCVPFRAVSITDAMSSLKNQSTTDNPFDFWTDKSSTSVYYSGAPRAVRSMLGGEENSILDVYGTGEYEFDKWTVKLYLHRGRDTSVEIRYGKNLVDFSHDVDFSNSFNGIVPYWIGTSTSGGDEEEEPTEQTEIVMLPEYVVYSEHAPYDGRDHIIPYDFSAEFSEKPTEEQLRNVAENYMQSKNTAAPHENFTINFVQLWQTEDFGEYVPLQRVGLCDTVRVYFSQLGIDGYKAKVVRVTYNVLQDRYDEMELGEVATNFAGVLAEGTTNQIVANIESELANQRRSIEAEYQAAIEYATDMIRGGMGGYVVQTVNANGQPIELLITDNLNLAAAQNVWRWNAGGLGHSSNGYEGPFDDVALTADGRINASMITTGRLTANLIRTGRIESANGKVYFDLDADELACNLFVGTGCSADISGVRSGNVYYPYFRVYHTGATSPDALLLEPPENGTGTSRISVPTGPIYFGIRSAAYGDEFDSYIYFHANETRVFQHSYHGMRLTHDGAIVFYAKRPGATSYNGGFEVNASYSKFWGDLAASGTKSRLVKTDNYNDRLLYCYETPTPLFGDIGEAQLDEDGVCYVDLDDIFTETIAEKVEYQVFLQKEGQGDCWVSEKNPRYFVIQGTPNLKVAWELKAKQKDYELTRLEQYDDTDTEINIDLFELHKEDLLESYISEQEEILNGNY